MLLRLIIKNFALIDDMDICFDSGLNILTGETGAGKSIIIDAINMVIGERASTDYIRTGEQNFEIEAVLEYNNPCVDKLLADYGITSEDNTIIVNRQITSQGRSFCKINGKNVPASFLKKISNFIIDIHGQHQHQSLLDKGRHLELLDLMGPDELSMAKTKVKECYNSYRRLKEALAKKKKRRDELYSQKKRLEYEIDEIEKANIVHNEDSNLNSEKQIIENAEKIFSALEESYNILYKGEDFPSISDNLSKIITKLEYVQDNFKQIQPIVNSLTNTLYEFEDISSTLRRYRDSIDFDIRKLDEINSRLNLIESLKAKYNMSLSELINYKEQASAELDTINSTDDDIDQINKQLSITYRDLKDYSKKLHDIRKMVADKLQKEIENELTDLGMKDVKFYVNIEQLKLDGSDFEQNNSDEIRFTKDGFDDIEFMISTNPGEPLKPLSKIVSGGETSRIMLALKSIIAQVDSISCLIFDEIDTGISGRTAQIVGEKLSRIAQNHQILCVTHSPQIASLGDTHFLIKKETKGNTTNTKVTRIEGQERINELARMLGGAKITSKTTAHAKEMLNMAQIIKSKA
jgi:DNA repair protein RecN (Recombination protein N)